jgi:hypothetical protein
MQRIFNKGFFVIIPSFFILVTSFYLIITSSFLFDDWGSLLTAKGSYGDSLANWEEIWAIRPLSWVVIPAIINVFGDNAILYFVLNSSFFLASVLILGLSLARIFSRNLIFVFLIISIAPSISSTVLLSPVNQLETTFSFIVIALLALLISKSNLGPYATLFAYFFLPTVALFFYESLIGTLILPLLITYFLNRKTLKFALLGLVLSVSIVFVWQKIIVLEFVAQDFSRIKGLNLGAFVSYIYAVIPGYFFNLVAVTKYTQLNLVIFLLLFASLFLKMIYMTSETKLTALPYKERQTQRTTVHVFIGLGMLASGILYFLSGLVADSSGYPNRTLLGFNILLGVLVWHVLERKSRLFFRLLASFLIAANLVWFFQVSLESNRASQKRIEQLEKITISLQDIDKKSGSDDLIFLDTPCFMPDTYSRVFIFCANWDLDSALRLRGYQGAKILLTNSSSTYSAEESELSMGGIRIDKRKSTLMEFTEDGFSIIGQYSDPINLYLNNKERFSRTNLSEIEGSRNNCLASGALIRGDLNLKSKLDCLRDPFPLH